MNDYSCIIFNLYQTILDDSYGSAEREKYRLDNIYTILEKSLFPIKFTSLRKIYSESIDYAVKYEEEKGLACGPFQQIEYLIQKLGIRDGVIFKKIYDSYIDATLQISPKLRKNVTSTLNLLKERGKKISIISTTDKTTGDIIKLLLKDLMVYHLFDDFNFSDGIGITKPLSALIILSIEKLRLDRKDAIYIGKLSSDEYSETTKAGLFTHLFNEKEDDIYQLAIRYSGGYL